MVPVAKKQMTLELSPRELRIMVQSLVNCLATCQTHAVKPDEPCEDCDAARALKEKIESHLES